MSSSKAEGGGALGFIADAGLAFDPDEVLVRDPGLLLDPRFLAVLVEELEGKLGPDEARLTLLQMGFLHGLRDAMLVVGQGLDAPSTQAVSPAASPLPLRLRPRAGSAGLELEGCWPERSEACVHLARSGVAKQPVCSLSAGYTSGWLSGILDADLLVIETNCSVSGDAECRFVARETSVWAAEADERADEALGALPYAAMRKIVAREVAELEEPPHEELCTTEPAVHIWGPVMVIPFGGVDEALAALDLISHDREAAAVSVVVIDLTGAIIDEAFGAVALERILERIESWSAEAILAAPSSLSGPVLESLDHQPLMVQKDLEEAIAAAFRVAESQRRTL